MVLVAFAMVAIISMAALSIDVITLYLAREEAQRSADGAALAAARIISLSGITGDPSNESKDWSSVCGVSGSTPGIATQAAQAVVQQNAVGGASIATSSITVTYSGGSGGSITSNTDCTHLSTTAFGVNPMVTVQVQQTALPTFFSRIWGNKENSVSATATAEAFNPSNSGNAANQSSSGNIIPVQPRCVKPLVVPNEDPWNPAPSHGNYCAPGGCSPFVSTADGSIQNQGISTNGGGTGAIGETFWLMADCRQHPGGSCQFLGGSGGRHPRSGTAPEANYGGGTYPSPNLLYVPGQVGTTVTAIPSCTQGDSYEEAIEGCDAPTNYQCGVPPPGNNNVVDLTINPVSSGATTNGVQCLIQQSDTSNTTSSSGQDSLNPFGNPSSYPFQIVAGSSTALGKNDGLSTLNVSSSASVVSLPIYDQTATLTSGTTNTVTFVGFLQVFINAVDANGNLNVTVLNVAGCGNGTNPTGTAVNGSSPVPVRLITPP